MSVRENSKNENQSIPIKQGLCSVFLVGIAQIVLRYIPPDFHEIVKILTVVSPFISFLIVKSIASRSNKHLRAFSERAIVVDAKYRKMLNDLRSEESRLRKSLKNEKSDTLKKDIENQLLSISKLRTATITLRAEETKNCDQ